MHSHRATAVTALIPASIYTSEHSHLNACLPFGLHRLAERRAEILTLITGLIMAEADRNDTAKTTAHQLAVSIVRGAGSCLSLSHIYNGSRWLVGCHGIVTGTVFSTAALATGTAGAYIKAVEACSGGTFREFWERQVATVGAVCSHHKQPAVPTCRVQVVCYYFFFPLCDRDAGSIMRAFVLLQPAEVPLILVHLFLRAVHGNVQTLDICCPPVPLTSFIFPHFENDLPRKML